eukprot:gnl/TRDRNA2_/TRDRNA2_149200_c0_seq1.p1 gnl/TRDRNA2_/TRDRNA2_149200_c0~~gnl/TRDRNA2_/TRDRNA2_149200_c0_seq1.p1  ORF type:complete len:183 (+),score=33.12 gnl/TRDRNA2_/TRDRNA2_149200_c0_seq1:1-549(+)
MVTSDPNITAILKRMHRIAMMPEGYADRLQIGSYEKGGKTKLHLDSHPKMSNGFYKPLTLQVYLNGDGSASTGGETVFPAVKMKPTSLTATGYDPPSKPCGDLEACCKSKGQADSPMQITPKAGNAVLIQSNHALFAEGDPKAKYGECPAGAGGKWVARLVFHSMMRYGAAKLPKDPEYDLY